MNAIPVEMISKGGSLVGTKRHMKFELSTNEMGTTYLFCNGENVRLWHFPVSRAQFWFAIEDCLEPRWKGPRSLTSSESWDRILARAKADPYSLADITNMGAD